MKLKLQLVEDPSSVSVPMAWFLPGADSERWLHELGAAGLAQPETKLYPVPQSARDRSTIGLLVLAPTPAEGTLGIPCQCIGGRLYFPVGAKVFPPLIPEEVASLLPLPVNFLHPANGLSAFDGALRIWDLLEPPIANARLWSYAREGMPPLPRFAGVVLVNPPTGAEIFGDAGNDIGSDPIKNLPPSPDEPKNDALSQANRKLQEMLAKGLSKMGGGGKAGGIGSGMLGSLGRWGAGKLGALNSEMERLRNKEVSRLLHLLKTDPEAGLRHAIPFSSFSHRGRAQPGVTLGSHSIDFSIGGLGGGSADFWNIPPDYQAQLLHLYREAANRELQLGRHRRAAYIYAELLGDLPSAVSALKAGRHFREAALLYEHHLNNPREAARCLEEGGLLLEAVQRYETLGLWMPAALLYQKLGNLSAATGAFRRVIDEKKKIGDLLGAAKVVDESLGEVDEALVVLQSAWPSSHQAVNCLSYMFTLWARLGWHDEARKRIAELRAESLSRATSVALIPALAGHARSYPDSSVCGELKDLAVVLISRELRRPVIANNDVRQVMSHLAGLFPEDKLLTRDTTRYLANSQRTTLRLQPRTTPSPGKPVHVVRLIELPRQIEWLELRAAGIFFFAVGVTPKRLTLVRGSWEGEIQSLSWNYNTYGARERLIFEPIDRDGFKIALAAVSGPEIPRQVFPAIDGLNQEASVGSNHWLGPTDQFPVAVGGNLLWSLHLAEGRAVLSSYDRPQALQNTVDITHGLLDGATRSPTSRVRLTAFGAYAAVGLGNRLVITRGSTEVISVNLPREITGLCPTLPHTRAGVAVSMESGASMYWLGRNDLIELDRDLPSPRVAFASGGPAVVASLSRGMLVDMDARGVTRVSRFQLEGGAVGLVTVPQVNHFGLLNDRGEVRVYKVER